MKTDDPIDPIDWTLCTWDGARRAQLRGFAALSLRQRLEAVEGMCDLARWFHERRRQRGLPTVPLQTDDPATVASRRPRGLPVASPPAP